MPDEEEAVAFYHLLFASLVQPGTWTGCLQAHHLFNLRKEYTLMVVGLVGRRNLGIHDDLDQQYSPGFSNLNTYLYGKK